jgi:hypothetical protein
MLLLAGDFSTQNVSCGVKLNMSNKVSFVILVAVAVKIAYFAHGSKDFSSTNLEYHMRNGTSFGLVDFPMKLENEVIDISMVDKG